MTGLSIDCPACHRSLTIPHARVQAGHRHFRIKGAGQRLSSSTILATTNPKPRPAHVAVRRIVVLCILAAAAYVAWPYFAMARWYLAVQAQDQGAIAAGVDFPALHASLQADANAFLAHATLGGPVVYEGITAAAAPAAAAAFADTWAATSTVYQLFENQTYRRAHTSERLLAGSEPEETSNERFCTIKFAFFSAPTEFFVKTRQTRFLFRLRRGTWRLSAVRFEPGAVGGIGFAPLRLAEPAAPVPPPEPVTNTPPEPATNASPPET